MKFFLDSAKIEEIKQAVALGIIDGVTTNPSLIKKALESCSTSSCVEDYINEILHVCKKRPVSLEVEGGSADDMYKQGCALYKRFKKPANNVVIKIPIDPTLDPNQHIDGDGFKVIRKLSHKGIPVNVTLIFTPEQALLAAKAGARYVSPFVGRMDDKIRTDHSIAFQKTDYFPSYGWNDNGHILEDNGIISGVDLVAKICDIFTTYGIKTEVLAASLRSTRQVREVALVGTDVATVPYKLLDAMLSHPKTIEGMQSFMKDGVTIYNDLMK